MCVCVCFQFYHISKTQTVQTRQTHIQLLTAIAIESGIYLPSPAAQSLYSISHALKPNAGMQLMLTVNVSQ